MLDSLLDIEFNPNKYLVHLDRISALSRGEETPPVTLELDVSSVCNHRCTWCVDPPGVHSNRLMPVPVVKRILEEAHALGTKGIVFKGGGECTLHPEFDEILRIASEMDFEIGVVTHGGILFKKNLLEAMVQYCAYIRISIDGPTPELRREIHGADDLAALIANIKNLVALRKSKRHPILGATFCLDYKRRSFIDACIRLGDYLGLDYLLIRPPFQEEVGFSAHCTPGESAVLRDEIRKAAENYQGNIPIIAGNWIGDRELEEISPKKTGRNLARRDIGIRPFRFNGIEHRTKRCLASSLTLVISAEGEVWGCCCLRGIPDFSFGKICYEKGITLASIMKSVKHKQSLTKMRKAECLPHCTHPLTKINELIEYLALPEKYHSSFV